MDAERLSESAIGSLLGCAVGDALGELAFSHTERNDLLATAARMPVLRYTDDAAMTVVLAEHLIQVGHVEPRDLGDRFAAAYEAEPWRGYGPGPPEIFAEVRRSGRSYVEVAGGLYAGEGSFGNGAAMRVAPVGLAFHDDLARVYTEACRSAAVTHAHPVGQDGAAVQAATVAIAADHYVKATELDPLETAKQLASLARTEIIREKMDLVARALEEGWTAVDAADAIGRSIAVQESMPFAVFAFLSTPSDSLRVQETAVLNGGDRDTLGAMAMAASGAYLGAAGLRKALTNRIEGRDRLIALARGLAEAAAKG